MVPAKHGPVVEKLASEKCSPCEGISPLTTRQIEDALRELPGWIHRDGSIEKEFRFRSYKDGLEFVYAVGKIAEEENHHPEMIIGWRRVRLVFQTHSTDGLSKNDFIMAAKAELEYDKLESSISDRSQR